MVSLEVIALELTGLSITASIVYYANVLANSNKTQQLQLETRQAQLFMQIYNEFHDPDFLTRYFEVRNRQYKDFNEYLEKYANLRESDPEKYARGISVGTWFEGIGTLLKFELINPVMVYELMGGVVFGYWNTMGPVVLELQKTEPTMGIYVKYLYHEMEKLAKIRDPERDITI